MPDFLIALLFMISPACQYEDSANCAWDASTSGNGIGKSFVDVSGVAYFTEG